MDTNNSKFNSKNIPLLILFTVMFIVVLMMFKPFASVILWSLMLYIIMNPLYKKIISKFSRENKAYKFLCSLMAGLFSIVTILIIAILFFMIGLQLISQFGTFLSNAEVYFRENPDFMNDSDFAIGLKNFLEKKSISTAWMENFDIRDHFMALIQKYSTKIFSLSKAVVGGTSNFVVSLCFMIFILFFFYKDGGYLATLFLKAIPLNSLYTTRLQQKFSEIIKGLVSGYIFVALYQGVAAFIIMLIFRVPSALLFSVLLMFASFIPIVGAAIIWLPIGIVLIITKSVWQGILFLILCGFAVSFLDNFLRPFLLKDRINVHPLIIFFAILGGIKVFGMNGLILGPTIIIMLFTVLDMMADEEISINSIQ